MPALEEWLAGARKDGTPLDARITDGYRKNHDLPPLNGYERKDAPAGSKPHVTVHRSMPKVKPKMLGEPVGTMLSFILKECGIKEPACGSCREWLARMDMWGVAGCQEHRAEITKRLDDSSKSASWLDWAKVAAKGYLSSGALLDEAIRRTTL